MILIGKNEAGKSNVLKAIASLFGVYKVSNKDRRKRVDNEKIEHYFVRAVFDLNAKDLTIIEKRFSTKFKNTELIVFKSGYTLSDFIASAFRSLLIQVDIEEGGKPYFTTWEIDDDKFEFQDPLFVSGSGLVKEGLVRFDLYKEIKDILVSMYQEFPINCHYWQYTENYLLPASVDIDDFMENPTKYPSLHNVFVMCGRDDVKKEFLLADKEDGDYSNLLEQVSRRITATFQKVWVDFKGTSIQLLPNGDEILIKVVDKAKYSFEDRSDGFKKFISILLMLSTKSRSNSFFEHDLILIDEPDQSLYPTSATYLRNELLSIGLKAKVIYTTHSQYMIDSENLERHIVVEKEGDITSLKFYDLNSPFTKDELLRRAIGSSIFECLSDVNILFEGYFDRELFKRYCKIFNIERNFSGIGTVFLSGISGVDTLVQLLILANKKFIVVADSDQASKAKKRDFVRSFFEYKDCWLEYGDQYTRIVTMEDYFEIAYVKGVAKDSGLSGEYNSEKCVVENIDSWAGGDKKIKQELKRSLVNSFSRKDVSEDYGRFIELLKAKVSTFSEVN
jgi:predicted ATP-dependent endonuclease of OLD family